MVNNKLIKQAVLCRIAQGHGFTPSGRSKFDIGKNRVHVRYCSPPTYKFNINPNTLTADYELWICGNEQDYFLIPMNLIKRMYDDPTAYPDRHHPNITVVSVNTYSDKVTFAAGGKSLKIAPFRGSLLP